MRLISAHDAAIMRDYQEGVLTPLETCLYELVQDLIETQDFVKVRPTQAKEPTYSTGRHQLNIPSAEIISIRDALVALGYSYAYVPGLLEQFGFNVYPLKRQPKEG